VTAARSIRRAAGWLALLAALVLPAAAGAAPPRVSAPSAIVVEAGSGDVAYAKAADARRPIASATKLMTALITLERAKLSDVLPAARYRALPVESKINLRPGERMTVADLLRGLLIESANDAAETLAQGIAGSRASFVRQMNRRAQQLGLENTHFANPIGLDQPGNYSSARDLAKLTLALRRFSFFRRTVDREEVTLRSGARPRTIDNRNQLVHRYGWIDGVKTGRTMQAGWVLVASSHRGRIPLVSVVLGTPTEEARNADTLALLRHAQGLYRRVEIVSRGEILDRVPIRYRDGATLDLVASRSVYRVLRRGDRDYDVRVVERPDEVDGPVGYGERVARAEVLVHGRRVTRVALLAADEIAAASVGRKTQDWMTRPWTLVAFAAILLLAMLLTYLRRPRQPDPRSRHAREGAEAA